MKIFTYLSVLFFTRECQHVYNKLNTAIINKIDEGDYCTINLEKRYMIVYLSEDYLSSGTELDIKIKIYNSNNELKCHTIKIKQGYKEPKDLFHEIEDNILNAHIKYNPNHIILIYSKEKFRSSEIFKKIIMLLKEANNKIKENFFKPDFYYTYIIRSDFLWGRMFEKIRDFSIDGNDEPIKIPVIYVRRKDKDVKRRINLCIRAEKIFYFFEINLQELDPEKLVSLFEWKSSYVNNPEKKIGTYFYDLHKLVYVSEIDTRPSCFWICTSKKITMAKTKFKIFMLKDKIKFKQKAGDFIYSLNTNSNVNSTTMIIKNEIFTEFKEIFKEISVIENEDIIVKSIGMLYKVMEKGNKLLFLLGRILSRPGAALNIIFAHFLLHHGIIDGNELNKIIGKDEQAEFNKTQLLEKILKHTPNFYSIKFCLLLEFERYINENDVKHDKIFSTFIKIWDLIRLKEQNQSKSSIDPYKKLGKDNIYVTKLYYEVLGWHNIDIKEFKYDVWLHILKLATLFTESENNYCECKWVKCDTIKNDIITNYKLKKNDILQNNELIRAKLLGSTRKDSEKEKSMKIIQKIHKLIQRVSLNKILTVDSNKEVKNIFYDKVSLKFEKELREEGIKAMEEIYNNLRIKVLFRKIEIVNPNLVNEYKNKEIENFFHKLNLNIKANIERSCVSELPKIVKTLLECEIKNNKTLKARHQLSIKKIRKKLPIKKKLHIFNEVSGIKLHDESVKVIEDKIFSI
ncbi:uncharacterized protein VNE69_05164 [Vairimorpha necatrix]|uniref:Uncharacterized protein n=1 Tax=Vairimorpha necatrix TaxID=6039 RepID=A0AAX4JC72_9MICR